MSLHHICQTCYELLYVRARDRPTRGMVQLGGLLQMSQLQRANRRFSKHKLVEVSETVGWRGSHSFTAQVGGDKTGRMEDPAHQIG